MRKLPHGPHITFRRTTVAAVRPGFAPPWQQTRVRSAMAVSSVACAPAVCANMSLRSRSGFRHEVERSAGRDEVFFLGAVLEFPYDSLRVLHHPPAHVSLVHGLPFFRVLLQVSDAGKAQRQLRIVKVLLALEV